MITEPNLYLLGIVHYSFQEIINAKSGSTQGQKFGMVSWNLLRYKYIQVYDIKMVIVRMCIVSIT